jgi:tetratricopeptide (TPR) repeat protein
MQPLESPDLHHVSAALGWYELGNLTEARAEWDRLSPEGRCHPKALEVRWLILARSQDWDEAVLVAEALITQAPESCDGWLHRAYAMRRARDGGLEKAWAALRPAAEKFPRKTLIAYNLSCYATQMGRLDEGWEWFLRAIQLSPDAAEVRQMALCDKDLTPLWERIRGLS